MQQKPISIFIVSLLLSNSLRSQNVFDFGFSQSVKLRDAVHQLEKSKKSFEYRKLLNGKPVKSSDKRKIGSLSIDLRPLDAQSLASDLHGYILIPVFSILSAGLGAKYFIQPLGVLNGTRNPTIYSAFRPEWLLGIKLPWFSLQAESEYVAIKNQDAGRAGSRRPILSLGVKKDLLTSRTGGFRVYGFAGYTFPNDTGTGFYPRPFQAKVGLEWRLRARLRRD